MNWKANVFERGNEVRQASRPYDALQLCKKWLNHLEANWEYAGFYLKKGGALIVRSGIWYMVWISVFRNQYWFWRMRRESIWCIFTSLIKHVLIRLYLEATYEFVSHGITLNSASPQANNYDNNPTKIIWHFVTKILFYEHCTLILRGCCWRKRTYSY